MPSTKFNQTRRRRRTAAPASASASVFVHNAIPAKMRQLILNGPYPPIYSGLITIPAHTIVWRGYNINFDAVTARPAYYGNRETAELYANKRPDARLARFASPRELRLIDYRFMQLILTHLFEGQVDEERIISSASVSFGLCSYGHQLKLLDALYGGDPFWTAAIARIRREHRPKSIAEQRGIRVGETEQDAYVMGFLQKIFDPTIDGYIAPAMYSPYHHKNKGSMIHPEIVIFNPLRVKMYEVPETTEYGEDLPLTDIIAKICPNPLKFHIKSMNTIQCIKLEGGGQLNGHYTPAEAAAEEAAIEERYQAGAAIGARWRKQRELIYVLSGIPAPHNKRSIFNYPPPYTKGKIWGKPDND